MRYDWVNADAAVVPHHKVYCVDDDSVVATLYPGEHHDAEALAIEMVGRLNGPEKSQGTMTFTELNAQETFIFFPQPGESRFEPRRAYIKTGPGKAQFTGLPLEEIAVPPLAQVIRILLDSSPLFPY